MNKNNKNLYILEIFLRRNLNKLVDLSKNSKISVFFLLFLIILVFSISDFTGTQKQNGILGKLIKNYVEETAALAEFSSEDDVFLSQINNASNKEHSKSQTLKNIYGEAILQIQSILPFNNEERNQVISYTVQPGDTLSNIAKDFGVSINSIIWANKLKSDSYLTPGQELKIPPVSGVIHIVENGDTVESIAKKYLAKPEKIIDFNGLPKDGSLSVGQEIIVPDGQIKIANQFIKYSSKTRFAILPELVGFFIEPVKNGYNWGRIHNRNGVDIAISCGTPVYAAQGGKVVAAKNNGWNGGAGKFIKILHPYSSFLETLYAHLSEIFVEENQEVSQGQIIGLVGSTGRSTGCHLHFEVHGAKNPFAKY